jgi:UDPglucose--hexose-1-phosphate uridylyltransferase
LKGKVLKRKRERQDRSKKIKKKLSFSLMSGIRKQYFLSDYCVIAEGRAKSSSDFANAVEASEKAVLQIVFFAEGLRKISSLLLQYIENGNIFADTH